MDDTLKTALTKRAAAIRKHVLEMLLHCGYGHLGGSMSIVELLAVLYGGQLRHDPKNPQWDQRDYLVLSKGHSGPGLYSALAQAGFFDPAMLKTLNQNGTRLPSHPDRLKTPGIDATTGSLGQGTSVAAGMGQALKLKKSDQYVFLIVGDGELNEGQCWEAFQFIAGRNLDNVIVYIDENKRQLDGYTKDVLDPFDLVEKMAAFGFHAESVPGADIEAIWNATVQAKERKGIPTCLVLDSIKGQGIEYFEKMADNHSVKFTEQDREAAAEALARLESCI